MTNVLPFLLRWFAVAALTLAVGIACLLIARLPSVVPSTLGLRGRKRALALRGDGLFARVEPLMCWLAGSWARLPLGRARFELDRRLRQSGYYLGIDSDELLALASLGMLLGGAVGALVGATTGSALGGPWVCTPTGLLFGWAVVHDRVSQERDRRFREVSRRLPAEIDLLAMCMNAGIDLPGGLVMLAQHGDPNDVLVEEFTLILQELELGRTRALALCNFAERVPTEPVREFVAAVAQAEEKGTPLVEVLRIQAGMLRMRRSVLAEEAASRAGVLLIIPLMMQLCCVLILLLGSLFIEASMKGGLFS